MGQPYFSVVIDNYNYGRYVGQAIESVLAQGLPRAEVETIVVDDGSTDDSVEAISRFRDRVRLIRQDNRGQAGAFAAGFAAATGRVVCLLDADDYWLPRKLEETAKALGDERAGIVQHYQRDVDAAGRALTNPLPEWPERYSVADFLDGRFVNAATSSLAFRREVLDQVLPVPPDIFYLYDDYLLDHGLLAADIANVPLILGCHRLHGANNWAQGYLDARKLEGGLREIEAFRRYLEPKLKARGLSFTERYQSLQSMEVGKRRVLLAMHRGDRRAAWRAWRSLAAGHGASPLGLFRSATCLLALASPALYLGAYALYGRAHWLARARRRVLPD